jgi:uncharacterized repeat protein (TIGR02543 family)
MKLSKPTSFIGAFFAVLITGYVLIMSANAVQAAGFEYESVNVFGTTALDYGSAIENDSSGNLYVTGQFNLGTVDFDPSAGTDNQINSLGGYDVFLTKFNSDGTYAWTRTWGGTGNDASYNLAFDSSNNVYVIGEFGATVDFDPSGGVTSYVSAGSVDAFVSKFNTSGDFISVSVIGGASHDRGHGIEINSDGELYIAGKFTGTVDFDPTGGVDNQVSAGNYDAYLTKFNSDGTYAWTYIWGSTDRDTNNDMKLGSDGDIYLAGVFRGTVDFDPSGSTSNYTSVGLDDAYLSKFNSDGTYAWTKTWGSTTNDFSFNLRLNSDDDIYIIGSFQLTVDFDPTGSINSITSAGIEDSYVSKFQSDGTYEFTRTWGGTLMDEVLGITIDDTGNYFIGGFFNGTEDLDPTGGTDSYVSGGPYDMFVSMFDENDNYITSNTFGSTTETNWWDDQLYEVHANDGTLYVTGNYFGTADFDPGVGTDNETQVGAGDYFMATYSTSYTITFDAQEGSATPSQEATYNEAVGTLPEPTREGYGFSSWNTAADGSGTTYSSTTNYLVVGDITLYAQWGRNSTSGSRISPKPATPTVPASGASNPIGTNIVAPDGTVFTITADGKRSPYTSAGAYLSYGINSFVNTVPAKESDLLLPIGEFIPPRDGSITCSDRGADKGTCYLITGGVKAGFVSDKIFKDLGFSFSNSLSGDVSFMPSTLNISSASEGHRAGVLINNNGTLQIIGKNEESANAELIGIPSMEVLVSWGYDPKTAVLANSADKKLAQTKVLTNRTAGVMNF